MTENRKTAQIISGIFGVVVFAIGVLNLFLVHPVPGIVYLLISFIYFPWVNFLLPKTGNSSIPAILKIIVIIVLIWFTLGVSDLGDMID